MSFFDQVYDDMSWEEVCYRLPSELSVNALLRRINNLETLRMFIESVGSQPSHIKQLKDHVNSVLTNENVDDILKELGGEKFESVLFSWMDDTNRKRVRNKDLKALSTKFLFNSTDSNDKEGMNEVLSRVLGETNVNPTHLSRVLNKADDSVFSTMLNTILKDTRPEVRASILGVGGLSNKRMISDYQKAIGLKALAQCSNPNPIPSISILSISVFGTLKPFERLTALSRYLDYFPSHRKIQAFDPAPTKEEFDAILFAGCIEHNDLVNKINDQYHLITEADPPKEEDDEEED